MHTIERGSHAPKNQPTRRAVAPDLDGLDLDGLGALGPRELAALYREAPSSEQLDALDGHPRGRMLAVLSVAPSRVGRAVAALASASWFPWGGKSFTGAGTSGRGVNRVHLGGRHALFHFRTTIAPSVVDGRPCVVLDYDLPDNPSFIRAIHDEVREVAPGLYLGPAMWKTASGPSHVLWFALDTRIQADPVGGA